MIPEKKYKCSGDAFLPSVINKTPNSCYAASYNKPDTETARLQHARYPHEHTARSSHAQRQYNATTSNILTSFGAPYTTPLQVLAVTQEPFLRANTWVYSHKPKVYNRLLGPWCFERKFSNKSFCISLNCNMVLLGRLMHRVLLCKMQFFDFWKLEFEHQREEKLPEIWKQYRTYCESYTYVCCGTGLNLW